ncbi:hypothetical protein Gotri_008343 [Gossypium trilobum]|uniref:ATP synthase epsilon chain, chloroplastic n=1 Tax=Gossypium trilobum TaxID=34281 RepID=A0A7J9EJ34_9ROSI|nr:hypothetical protein [Gossypium trilobum]
MIDHSDDDRSEMMRMRIGHLRPGLLCITDMVCLLEVFLEVKEIILSTNSGQIGVLPNHAPIATAIDIGILRIRLNDQWLTIALMGGFARMDNNEITILVNDVEKGSDIDPQEAQQALEIAEANLRKAEGKRQTIEANLALRQARTRVEAINEIS